MKTTNQLLSVLGILSLAACSKGTIVSESNKSLLSQTAATVNTALVLNNAVPGNPLTVDLNPVPTSTISNPNIVISARTASPTLNMAAAAAGPAIVAPVINPATFPDKYEIFYSSSVASQLSQFAQYQALYQNYVGSLASNPSTPIPSQLLTTVSAKFTTYNLKTANISLRAFDLVNPNGAVITFGTSAWYGSALLPVGSGSALLSSFSKISFVKYGSGLFGIGGNVSGSVTNNVSNIAFYAASSGTPPTFAVSSPAISTIPSPDCHIAGIATAAVSSDLKTAAIAANGAALTNANLTVNKSVFLGYATSGNVINSIYRYDLPSGSPVLVASAGGATFAATCSAIVGSFVGETYTCAGGAPSACMNQNQNNNINLSN